MTNKLVVIINSLKVSKIKKILLYEMTFLVPNYSCLQNPWLGGCRPQIPVLSVLCPQLNLLNPPRTKFLGTPLTLRPLQPKNEANSLSTCWSCKTETNFLSKFESVYFYVLLNAFQHLTMPLMALNPIAVLSLIAFRFVWCQINHLVGGVSITHLLCFMKIHVTGSKNEKV